MSTMIRSIVRISNDVDLSIALMKLTSLLLLFSSFIVSAGTCKWALENTLLLKASGGVFMEIQF